MLQVAKTVARAGPGCLVVVGCQQGFSLAFCDAFSGATDLRRKIEDSVVIGVVRLEVSLRR